jgi:DMSO/TMAO reductase YedYZ molybdopterin-dependent catalytic subunit
MRQVRLSSRAVNLSLLALVAAGSITGLGAFLAGDRSGRWVLWAHAVAGFTIVLLFFWKRRIIAASFRRHGAGIWALPSLALLALLLASLGSGILWSTFGLPPVAGETGLTIHAASSLLLALLLIPHARAGWPRISAWQPGRRAFLQTTILFGVAALVWRSSESVSEAARLSGANRRFTGSRETSSFAGNDFPTNSWLLDDPRPIDANEWRLTVRPYRRPSRSLTVADIDGTDRLTATIDCTGGWFSTQEWRGTRLARLLENSVESGSIRSIVVRSETGYWRRLSMDEAATALLATAVGGEMLSHEHGAPLRLVVPNRRGYDWVKWVTSIEASRIPAWWKWPLPLS